MQVKFKLTIKGLMEKMEKRREVIKKILEGFGFNRKESKDKADTYVFEFDNTFTIYFYWKQGKYINIAVHPEIAYEELLLIDGVSLLEKNPRGLRAGTAMTDFPNEYIGLKPKDSKSKVGRLFKIEESKLSDFIKALIKANTSSQKTISIEKSTVNENFDIQIAEIDLKISKATHEMRLANAHIENEYKNKPGIDVDAIVKRRIGQSAFRKLLELTHEPYCHISSISKKSLLIASHIVPWSKSTSEEKTDPDNGLLLAVNWDAVFDKGLIAFNDEGKVVYSSELDEQTSTQLGLDRNAKLNPSVLTVGRKEYLRRHREIVFENWKR